MEWHGGGRLRALLLGLLLPGLLLPLHGVALAQDDESVRTHLSVRSFCPAVRS